MFANTCCQSPSLHRGASCDASHKHGPVELNPDQMVRIAGAGNDRATSSEVHSATPAYLNAIVGSNVAPLRSGRVDLPAMLSFEF